jgi:uncharacterized protein (DUF1330 family)
MPKGYWIPHLDVSDPEGYKAYMAATPAAHDKYGGRALVRGGSQEVVEGRARSRNVLREFPDYATALACYRSAEYQRAKPLRLPHAACDFVIIEGYDGVQPQPPATPPAAAARKGYWIAHVDVTDPDGYQAYMTADMVPFGRFGGRFLVRGGRHEVVEGEGARAHRRARISELSCGARLLPIGRLSSRGGVAQRQSRARSFHH